MGERSDPDRRDVVGGGEPPADRPPGRAARRVRREHLSLARMVDRWSARGPGGELAGGRDGVAASDEWNGGEG